MLLAYSDTGEVVKPFKGGRAFCPGCKTMVIAKCGSTNAWHWCHDSLEDCDGWKYEPKTQWHLGWQNYFHPDDTEVIIRKGNHFHIADIVGNNDVVIEVQHSPISGEEVITRETFYEKMIWILNARRFAENLEIVGFPVHLGTHAMKHYIEHEYTGGQGQKRIKLTIPITDDGTIEKCLSANPSLYKPCEDYDNVYYINNHNIPSYSPISYNYNLPNDLRSAYIAHAIHEQLLLKFPSETDSYSIDFQWHRMKRSFLESTMPIFLDIGPTLLIWITKYNYKNYFEGKVITRQRFLKKYRKRKPDII